MTWFELVLSTHVLCCCSLDPQECPCVLFCHCNPICFLYQTEPNYSLHSQSCFSCVSVVESCRSFAEENKTCYVAFSWLSCFCWNTGSWGWSCHLYETLLCLFWLSLQSYLKILYEQRFYARIYIRFILNFVIELQIEALYYHLKTPNIQTSQLQWMKFEQPWSRKPGAVAASVPDALSGQILAQLLLISVAQELYSGILAGTSLGLYFLVGGIQHVGVNINLVFSLLKLSQYFSCIILHNISIVLK